MPLEIGQLVINARVVPDSTPADSLNKPATLNNRDTSPMLIEQCVSEVLRILEERQER